MANTIQVKRKTTTGAPLVSSLSDGEMCLVVPDSKLYQRVDGSTLILINGADGFARIIHGTNAATARPSATFVEWIGSVEPTNAINNDTWLQTA